MAVTVAQLAKVVDALAGKVETLERRLGETDDTAAWLVNRSEEIGADDSTSARKLKKQVAMVLPSPGERVEKVRVNGRTVTRRKRD